MPQGMVFGNRTKAVCSCAMLLVAVASPGSADTVVIFQTVLGDFVGQLYDSVVSDTVQNFLNYVNDGDYANSFFHRLAAFSRGVPTVLQGGGFTYDADIGIESPWPRVPTDPPIALDYQLPNVRGTIAMARGGTLDSATSQFYFNLIDNSTTLGVGNGGGYAVFGEVMGNGMDVVDLLASQETVNKGQAPDLVDPAFRELPLINYSGSGPWTPMLEMFEVWFLPGDVDANGSVSQDDVSIILTHWGQAGLSWDFGDLDGNGTVDGIDYTEVLTYWTTGTAPEPPGGVPEPATLGLLLLGGLALIRRR